MATVKELEVSVEKLTGVVENLMNRVEVLEADSQDIAVPRPPSSTVRRRRLLSDRHRRSNAAREPVRPPRTPPASPAPDPVPAPAPAADPVPDPVVE